MRPRPFMVTSIESVIAMAFPAARGPEIEQECTFSIIDSHLTHTEDLDARRFCFLRGSDPGNSADHPHSQADHREYEGAGSIVIRVR
jgi:hypothetical protein